MIIYLLSHSHFPWIEMYIENGHFSNQEIVKNNITKTK